MDKLVHSGVCDTPLHWLFMNLHLFLFDSRVRSCVPSDTTPRTFFMEIRNSFL